MLEEIDDLIDNNGRVHYNSFLSYLKSNYKNFIQVSKRPFFIGKELYDGIMEDNYTQTTTTHFRIKDFIKTNNNNNFSEDETMLGPVPSAQASNFISRAIFALRKKRGTAGRANEIQIGRSAVNDLVIADYSISKSHATIIIEGDKYFILDKGSTNKTFINGSAIEPEQRVEIPSEADIAFGRIVFRFVKAQRVYELMMKNSKN